MATTHNPSDDEAPKDPGALNVNQSFDEKDFEGHRAHTVFVGVHLPTERRHSHRRHRHHHRDSEYSVSDDDRPRLVRSRRPRLSISEEGEICTPPAQRVQFILGEDVDDGTHESHPVFSEMEELVGEGEDAEWKEAARWIKFEEDVEEGGNRWSKPHVATLSLHSLFELRSLLLNGTVILDMEANSIEQISDLLLDILVNSGYLNTDTKDKVKEALLRKHRHQHQRRNNTRLPLIRSFADIGRNHSQARNGCFYALNCVASQNGQVQTKTGQNLKNRTVGNKFGSKTITAKDGHGSYVSLPADDAEHQMGFTTWFTLHSTTKVDEHSTSAPNMEKQAEYGKFLSIPGHGTEKNATSDTLVTSPSSISMQRNHSGNDLVNGSSGSGGGDLTPNYQFMRKIPQGAEASNIMVGEVDFLEKTLAVFIRLSTAAIIENLTEVPIPTRFIFILLGPANTNSAYHEIGRAMATLMSDEIFHEVAYKARNRVHLLAGVDEFLDAVTVLPPGEWDPAIRIEPPAAIPSQDQRKRPPEKIPEEIDEEEVEQKLREETGLTRTGRLFGGLKNDISRKVPWYWSDFKDALSMQCVASWIFLYFACLSPIITFGGLLSEATGKNMAAMESLVSGFVCGIGYGFFSGQPLTIMGSTGPVLVFETIVYDFCTKMGWDYLTFRFWIGAWVAFILMVLVALDASAAVCYITRFTEENFAALIAVIFIYKAIENVLHIGMENPINPYGPALNYDCTCAPPKPDTVFYDSAEVEDWNYNWTMLNKTACLANNGTLVGPGCALPEYVPDVFLMSVVLFFGTFVISIKLKNFKNALFFPTKIRQFVSDFAVIIAIFSMTMLDNISGVKTPKLEVPHEFKPTLPTRGWLIPPFSDNNPTYSIFLGVFPALLGTILIFMDQQITSVIMNRRENKLRKSCGYHLDLFVLSILIFICSLLGIPWFVAATVLSINHVNSLKIESECAAPGEKPQFLGVREQRVTHILIFLMMGMSVFITPLLGHIPMPVLYGVFLYMGSASLNGLQFFDRLLIMFMPNKYQPDYMYLRQVPVKKVHMFTLIQLACFIMLWVIKSFSTTSILFPLMLVVMVGIRKSLDLLFTRRELKILDDVMPSMSKASTEDLKKLDDDVEGKHLEIAPSGNLHIPLANGNIMKIPLSSINISEEVNRTGIWKQVNEGNSSRKEKKEKPEKKSPKTPGKKKHEKKSEKREERRLEKRLSTMTEEEEEDGMGSKPNSIKRRDSWIKKGKSQKSGETPV